MPSLKEVRGRIVSISSTQQITKAMKMVSAAKLRKAQDAITQMRPYAIQLNEILKSVSNGSESTKNHPLLQQRLVQNVLVVVVTSDRGLCGAFNANIQKSTLQLIQEKYPELQKNKKITVFSLGKKGLEFFAKRNYTCLSDYTDIFANPSFKRVKEAAEIIMEQFLSGKYDVVEIIYNEFKNVATQILVKEQLLPLPAPTTSEKTTDFLFEPSEEEIINELLPKSIAIKLFKAVLESNASEHGARMMAMDKATDNAGELLKELRLMYNRSRQAAITKEILEIVGGAEALAAG